ncbi:MAG: glycosyltransferase family 4 protein [Candidatus Rifleibacteriota bacterium]
MKIIHSLEGKTWSGGQQQAFFLALEQRKLGHEVLLMCQKGSELENKAREKQLDVWPVDYRREIYLPSMIELTRAYRCFKPDVVNVHRAWAHTQWLFVSLLFRFRGLIVTRRVLFKPDFNPVSPVKYRTPVLKGFIAVSRAVKRRLTEIGVKESKIQVVHSATDTRRFSPDLKHELTGEWPVPQRCPAALLVGNFNSNKGHELLIRSFNKIARQWPELHLVVVGKETDSQKLQQLANLAPEPGRIHLLGFRNDVPALMQKSAFTVNASYQEGFSGTIRESLALEVPVIASNIPANVELNSMIPLLLFEAGNEASFANAIMKMKNNYPASNERHKLRELTLIHFSVEAMVKKTLWAYKELL